MNPFNANQTDLRKTVAHIAKGPVSSARKFTPDGLEYSDIYALADRLRTALDSRGTNNRPICLCAESRVVITATLLASLATDFQVVIPYSQSESVIGEARKAVSFDLAVVDKSRPMPAGVELVQLDKDISSNSHQSSIQIRDMDSTWIYLFTGGTTGKPQVWSKSPRNLFAETLYLLKTFSIRSDDCILATVPAYHIYGLLYSVLAPLTAGSTVIAQTATYPGEMETILAEHRPTIFISAPLHYRALRDHSITHHALRLAFSSAAPLHPPDGDIFTKKTGVPIHEVYGSTETGGIASRCRALGEENLTPFDCVDWKVKTDRLWIRSDFLSSELKKDTEGYFRVADRVVQKDQGRFLLKGRSDAIVKVGGHRVDLGVIREKIRGLSKVRDAAVIAKSSQTARETVILALVEGNVTEYEIKNAMIDLLETHERPRRVKVIDHLPRSATGKFDRQAMEKLFDD